MAAQREMTVLARDPVDWWLRLPAERAAYGDHLIANRHFTSRADLVCYLVMRKRIWTQSGAVPRTPLDLSPEQCYLLRFADAEERARLHALARRDAGRRPVGARARWHVLVPADLDDYAVELIAAGWFTSNCDFVSHSIAAQRRWDEAGYPTRVPLEYTPTQAIYNGNRVTPRPLHALP